MTSQQQVNQSCAHQSFSRCYTAKESKKGAKMLCRQLRTQILITIWPVKSGLYESLKNPHSIWHAGLFYWLKNHVCLCVLQAQVFYQTLGSLRFLCSFLVVPRMVLFWMSFLKVTRATFLVFGSLKTQRALTTGTIVVFTPTSSGAPLSGLLSF